MITIGIHIGYFTIHISQSYIRPGDSHIQFDTVQWSSHAHTEWNALYGGALPNAYDPSSGKTGYDAVDEIGLDKASRLNSEFFHDMLGDGAPHELACRAWSDLQQSLRRCPALRINEPVNLVLLLDGVDLSSAVSKWRPWQRGEDRTPELLEQLRILGPRAGFTEPKVASDRSVIERYVATQDDIQAGDIVVMVGGAHTRLWEITDSGLGALKPVYRTEGIENLVLELQRSEGLDGCAVTNVLGFLKEPERQQDAWRGLERWRQKRLFPPILKALGQASNLAAPTPRRLLAVGEGAALIQGLDVHTDRLEVVDWQRNHLFIPAHGGAALAIEYSRASKE